MIYVGTSGYSYKEWKGSFYPEKIPAKDMLPYYASRLQAVELNNTFYRLPQPSMVESWKAQVPENFRFSVKASQRITHFKRLKDVSEETRFMLETVSALEDRLGVVLFQLPPNMKKDLERLETFLKGLPRETPPLLSFGIRRGLTTTCWNCFAVRTARSAFRTPTICRPTISTRLPIGATCDCDACNTQKQTWLNGSTACEHSNGTPPLCSSSMKTKELGQSSPPNLSS